MQNGSFNVYRWSEKNENFLFADADGIAFGCDEEFGLFIGSDLSYGYSNPCSTFDSPRFTKNQRFEIKFFEVWALNVD
jgi:hypothetical protein